MKRKPKTPKPNPEVVSLNSQVAALVQEVDDLTIAIAGLRKREVEYERTAKLQASLIAKLRQRLEEAEHTGMLAASQAASIAKGVAALVHAIEPFANKVELVPAEGDAAVKLTHSADDYRRAAKAYRACK